MREPDEAINFDRAAEFPEAARDVGDVVADAFEVSWRGFRVHA